MVTKDVSTVFRRAPAAKSIIRPRCRGRDQVPHLSLDSEANRRRHVRVRPRVREARQSLTPFDQTKPMRPDRRSLPNEANRDRVAGFAKRSQRPGAWPGMAFCETKPTAGGTGGLSTSGIQTGHWWASHQCHPEWQIEDLKPGPNRSFHRNPTAGCLGGHLVLRNEQS